MSKGTGIKIRPVRVGSDFSIPGNLKNMMFLVHVNQETFT